MIQCNWESCKPAFIFFSLIIVEKRKSPGKEPPCAHWDCLTRNSGILLSSTLSPRLEGFRFLSLILRILDLATLTTHFLPLSQHPYLHSSRSICSSQDDSHNFPLSSRNSVFQNSPEVSAILGGSASLILETDLNALLHSACVYPDHLMMHSCIYNCHNIYYGNEDNCPQQTNAYFTGGTVLSISQT